MYDGFSGVTVPAQPIYASRDEAVRVIVAEAVEAELRAGRPFTALDISNNLKARCFAVRHSEVAPVVRDLYAGGAFRSYGYDREMIEVNTQGGKLVTQAFLYLHDDAVPSDYGGRVQDALPPVADGDARDLMTYVPAAAPSILSATGAAPAGRRGSGRRGVRGGQRSKHRRDGALPIPKRLVAQAGWNVGDVLTLTVGANLDDLRLLPASSGVVSAIATVRVWADLRVRVAKTKLRATVQSAFDAAQAAVTFENGAVKIGAATTSSGA